MSALSVTPLTGYHVEIGAKMVPRNGWNLPLCYPDGAAEEHLFACKHAVAFDLGHRSLWRLTGKKALQAVESRSLHTLPPVGETRKNLILNAEGGVTDEVWQLRMGEEDLLVSGDEAGNFRGTEALGESLFQLELAGPEAAAVLEALGAKKESLPEGNRWGIVEVDQVRAISHRAEGLGCEAFRLLFDAEVADQLWDLLMEMDSVTPAGLAARESLRLEAGIPAFGAEFRHSWPVKAPEWMLMKAELEGRRAARMGSAVFNAKGEAIGEVTTGAFCPTLGVAAALCRIEAVHRPFVDDLLLFDAGDVRLPGNVTEILKTW